MPSVFVTGTDTNVGKTIVSAMLVAGLKTYGYEPRYFKPVQTGLDSDSETVRGLTGAEYLDPCYFFPQPKSPHFAARENGQRIDLMKIQNTWSEHCSRSGSRSPIVVEGAGGILVPLTDSEKIVDLVAVLQLPLVIVSSTRLGTINHTLLTVEAVKSRDLKIAGIILVGDLNPELKDSLQALSHVPVIAEIPLLSEVNFQTIASAAQTYFPQPLIETLFCLKEIQ